MDVLTYKWKKKESK